MSINVFTAKAQRPAVPSQQEINRPFDETDQKKFEAPPRVHYPETWFHFIGGNVSTDGVTADLEAIAEAGFSGVQLFHGQFGGPWPGVEPQIPCLSEPWDAAVKHTAEECKRLGLRFTMQNCPGWAMSGGPWIQPDNAMRHLVWSRTDVNENQKNEPITLPQPQPSGEPWRDYRDIIVLAFPTPLDDTNQPLRPESIKSNRDDLPWVKCFSGNAEGKLRLAPSTAENPNWVEVTFVDDTTLRTVEFPSINGFLHAFCYEPGVNVKIETISENGDIKKIMQTDLPQASWQDDRPISLACDETCAKTFRVTIINKHEMQLNSLRLFSAARKNNWESEAGWTLRSIVREGENPKQTQEAFIDPEKILDLSAKMTPEGKLVWEIPSGNWTVLRIGHVNTGMRNGPAPPEGTGWECDKLSTKGPETHFNGYIGRLLNGPLEGGLLNNMLLDSWECKTQTWTPGLDKEFEQSMGYSFQKYLPAVFGYVVKDHETSKRFLRDWRGVIGDLFANKFYGRMASLAKENGLTIQYETAAGDIFPADILEYFKHADIPMCEFWQPFSNGFVGSLNFKPIKPTASAAHVYGKPRVAAEAFTSFELTWDEHWEMLKEVFNINAAEGVTHCVFHTYTHNPRTDFLPPGTSFGSNIGTPFLRGQTWWKHISEFNTYLARCSYMLERGKPVVDVLWYLGDEIDHKPNQEAAFPEGYKYDYCNHDVLLNRLTVKNGMLCTPEGIEYRVLWIPDNKRMLPETLKKLRELIRKGATVIADRPEGLATLREDRFTQSRFDFDVNDLWEDRNGVEAYDRGKIVSGIPLDAALKELYIAPDAKFRYSSNYPPSWLHRRVDGADWYYICTAKDRAFHEMVEFRCTADTVELWNPVTGKSEEISFALHAGRTQISLELPKAGSCFVVFRHGPETVSPLVSNGKPTFKPRCQLTLKNETSTNLSQPWTLNFPDGWGTPKTLQINELKAWKDLDVSDEGKAFSGTVQYSTTFNMEKTSEKCRYHLDLGEVEMIAVVKINGKKAGTLWCHPYQIDVTEFIKEGENTFEIDVTGTWFNRLVYDAALPEDQRKTWTISGPAKDQPPRNSGLLGPVSLKIEEYEGSVYEENRADKTVIDNDTIRATISLANQINVENEHARFQYNPSSRQLTPTNNWICFTVENKTDRELRDLQLVLYPPQKGGSHAKSLKYLKGNENFNDKSGDLSILRTTLAPATQNGQTTLVAQFEPVFEEEQVSIFADVFDKEKHLGTCSIKISVSLK